MKIKSANYFLSLMMFLLSFSQNAFAMEEPMEPKGIDIVRKALVNRELKNQYQPEASAFQTSPLPNLTFSGALLTKTNADPVSDWVNAQTPTWNEDIDSCNTKRLQERFDEYGLNPIAKKMRKRVRDVAGQETQHKDYFSFYHGTAPNYGFVYTVQSILQDFLDIEPSNGVWNFRWDKGPSEPTIRTITDLIKEVQISLAMDESDLFRKSALCGVPSIYTNFNFAKESCAQLWFKSASVHNSQVAPVDSHSALLEKVLKSLGFEQHLLFDLRNTLSRDVYRTYPTNGRLFQIFIRPNAAKELVYLSSTFGRPCTFSKNGQEISNINQVLEAYRNNEDIQAAAMCDGINKFVPINEIQERILFKEEYFRNPALVKVKDHFICEEKSRPLLKKCEETIEETLIQYIPCWLDTNPKAQKSYPLLMLKQYVDEGTEFYKRFYATQEQK